MTPLRFHLRWVMHALRLRRNPLRRTVDRVTAAVTAAIALLGLAALPLAVFLGLRIYQHESQQAARSATNARPVAAVLTTDASSNAIPTETTGQLPSVPAVVQWPVPGGSQSATVNVPGGSAQGTAVTVWLDSFGHVTESPATPATVVGRSVLVVLAVVTAGLVCCTGLILAVHRVAYVYAGRQWEREWNAVGGRGWRLRY